MAEEGLFRRRRPGDPLVYSIPAHRSFADALAAGQAAPAMVTTQSIVTRQPCGKPSVSRSTGLRERCRPSGSGSGSRSGTGAGAGLSAARSASDSSGRRTSHPDPPASPPSSG